MNDYLTEQEQIQQLKTWLKQYAPTVIAGVLIALAVSTGWRYWQNYRNNILAHASSVYDEMLTARAQNNPTQAIQQAQKLMSQYSNSPYANMAALLLAREAVLKKNYAEAITQLDWVVGHAHDRSLKQIALLREARILIFQQKPDEALTLLSKISDKSFSGLIDEVRGDALLAKNDRDGARKAYQQALAELPNAEVIRPILQLKYENLTTQENKQTV